MLAVLQGNPGLQAGDIMVISSVPSGRSPPGFTRDTPSPVRTTALSEHEIGHPVPVTVGLRHSGSAAR